jgi:hypothetical protein
MIITSYSLPRLPFYCERKGLKWIGQSVIATLSHRYHQVYRWPHVNYVIRNRIVIFWYWCLPAMSVYCGGERDLSLKGHGLWWNGFSTFFLWMACPFAFRTNMCKSTVWTPCYNHWDLLEYELCNHPDTNVVSYICTGRFKTWFWHSFFS